MAAFPFDASHVVAFHEACLDFGKWPDEEAPAHPEGDVWPWVEANHVHNARSRHDLEAPHAPVATMDAQRRETIVRIDEAIVTALKTRMTPTAPPLRETPGEMIDRLSILSVRIRALALSGGNAEALETERRACTQKLRDALLECAAGRARFI